MFYGTFKVVFYGALQRVSIKGTSTASFEVVFWGTLKSCSTVPFEVMLWGVLQLLLESRSEVWKTTLPV